MNPGSHVTNRTVQAASSMWTARRVTSGAIRVATCLTDGPIPPLASGPRFRRRLPSSLVPRSSVQATPAALWLAGVLALADPAERRLGTRLRAGLAGRRQVLAVTPGAARALIVVPLSARDADH